MTEKMLTKGEVAERCKVSAVTVSRWLRAGVFPNAQKGAGRTSPWRVPESDVVGFLHRRTAEGVTGGGTTSRAESAAVVLIIEDDQDMADIFEFILTRGGLKPRVIGSGSAAMTWLDSVTPDVIVLDLMLPGVSGEEILDRVRGDERFAESKVIVLTAYPDLLPRGEERADAFFLKPVMADKLSATVKSLLE